MTDFQLYLVTGIPLVGILCNAALYIGKLSDMDTRLSVLEDRQHRDG